MEESDAKRSNISSRSMAGAAADEIECRKKMAGAAADEIECRKEIEQLQEILPRAEWLGVDLVKHQGFWFGEGSFRGTLSFQRNFQAQDTDIFVATMPKCGTTWLKALVFAIVNRNLYPNMADHPLSKSNPHKLVPFVQSIYTHDYPFPDLTSIPSPRLFGTHAAFETMPASCKNSSCRVVYMCRNALDAFTSSWHFLPAVVQSTAGDSDNQKRSLEANFDKFCKGVELYGPFLDHVLGYWRVSQKRPDKVLFLMYEDVKQDPAMFVAKIAEFLGCSFSPEEEKDGKIEEITRLCSFETLSEMEINKRGTLIGSTREIEHGLYFRKGEVGDWVNLLGPSMAQRYDDIAKHKLEGSGLSFKFTTP